MTRAMLAAPPWLTAVVLLGATHAHAQQEQLVSVMTLVSEAGDDETAIALTDALRVRARQQPGWRVNPARTSLSQLALVHDCDAGEDSCLERIAEGADAALFVHGALEHDAEGHAVVTLQVYERGRGSWPTTAHLELGAPPVDHVAAADALMAQLHGEEPAPDEEPILAAPPPEEIPADEPPPIIADIEHDYASPEPGSSLVWLGYALLGTAAVSTGLMVYSWTRIDAAQHDPTFERYRELVAVSAPDTGDVCDAAQRGEAFGISGAELATVNDACDQGKLHQTLQYVFLGLGVATAAAGGLVLVLDGGDDEHATLQLLPVLGPGHVGASADLRF